MSSSKSKQLLDRSLDSLPTAAAYWVAYSGGIDSHVLLHLLAERRDALPGALGAVHVDHGIQQQSGDWEIHCCETCAELGVPFKALHVTGRAQPGESPEAAARAARYRGLAEWLPSGALLLTAQHQDDQAETLLLQLLRGAGPRGLAAMPERAPLGGGWLCRPFLGVRRRDIENYAHSARLRWVEDPSNTDLRYDRNLLRQRLLPQLRERWPGLGAVLARAAAHQADQLEISAALAEIDYGRCRDQCPDRMLLSKLITLSPARQRNLLRYWVEQNRLPLPSRAVVERIRAEMLTCRDDAEPLVHWSGAELRRYRDRLYLMPPLPEHDPRQSRMWRPLQPLKLDSAGGVLSVTPVGEGGWRMPTSGAPVEVRFRQGGEILQPAGRAHHHRLAHLFQEWGIPVWERDRVPLIYIDGELAAVAGLCVAQPFAVGAGETGVAVQWRRSG